MENQGHSFERRSRPTNRDLSYELYGLGMSVDEMKGKKSLSIGVGYAEAVRQGVEDYQLDMYGVDIVPMVKAENVPTYRKMILDAQAGIQAFSDRHPGRMVVANAVESLPFADNSMDIVTASFSLPFYAQSPAEAITSMSEMVRVAKERVSITTGWDERTNPRGYIRYGQGENAFEFRLKDFAKALEGAGVTWEVRQIPPHQPDDYPQYNIQFDTTNKDTARLFELRSGWTSNPDQFLAPPLFTK